MSLDGSKKFFLTTCDKKYNPYIPIRDVVGGLGQKGGPQKPGGAFLGHQNHLGGNFFLKNAIKS